MSNLRQETEQGLCPCPGHLRSLCSPVAGHTEGRTSQTPQHSERSPGESRERGGGEGGPPRPQGGPPPPARPGPPSPRQEQEEEEKESDRKSEVSQQPNSYPRGEGSPSWAAPPSEEGPPPADQDSWGSRSEGPNKEGPAWSTLRVLCTPSCERRSQGGAGAPQLLLTIV